MVVHSLGALEHGVQWQLGAWLHGLRQLAILQLHAPDAGTSGSAVLLEHALAVGQGLREGLVERLHVVVSSRVIRHQVSVIELDQRILGTVGHHFLRSRHAHQAGLVGQLGQQLKVTLFSTWNVARIHAGDVRIVIFRNVLEDFFCAVRVEVHNLGVPSLVSNRVDDGHRIPTVSVIPLVVATLNFKYNNALLQCSYLSECARSEQLKIHC